MRKPPQEIIDLMKKHGIKAADLWDCHGTWVIKHRAVQQIAAAEGVSVQTVMEHHNQARKEAIFRCTATLGDASHTQWGECAEYNSKNTYPIAIAQKRAEDRAILLALRLSGYIYSDVEADEFKKGASAQSERPQRKNGRAAQDTFANMRKAAG